MWCGVGRRGWRTARRGARAFFSGGGSGGSQRAQTNKQAIPPPSKVVLEAGYVEDHLITNVKIALGLLA